MRLERSYSRIGRLAHPRHHRKIDRAGPAGQKRRRVRPAPSPRCFSLHRRSGAPACPRSGDGGTAGRERRPSPPRAGPARSVRPARRCRACGSGRRVDRRSPMSRASGRAISARLVVAAGRTAASDAVGTGTITSASSVSDRRRPRQPPGHQPGEIGAVERASASGSGRANARRRDRQPWRGRRRAAGRGRRRSAPPRRDDAKTARRIRRRPRRLDEMDALPDAGRQPAGLRAGAVVQRQRRQDQIDHLTAPATERGEPPLHAHHCRVGGSGPILSCDDHPSPDLRPEPCAASGWRASGAAGDFLRRRSRRGRRRASWEPYCDALNARSISVRAALWPKRWRMEGAQGEGSAS